MATVHLFTLAKAVKYKYCKPIKRGDEGQKSSVTVVWGGRWRFINTPQSLHISLFFFYSKCYWRPSHWYPPLNCPFPSVNRCAEPIFVNLLRSTEIESQPGGPVRQPYLSFEPVRPQATESIPRNRFLGSINVYKYGRWTVTAAVSSCGILKIPLCTRFHSCRQSVSFPLPHRDREESQRKKKNDIHRGWG